MQLRSTDSSSPEALNQAEAIEALLIRLERAARQLRSPTDFYDLLLRDVLAALAGISAAAWVEADGSLTRLQQVVLEGRDTEPLPMTCERQLAASVLASGGGALLEPGAALPETGLRNESRALQCFATRSGEGLPGVVLRVGLRPSLSLAARETASSLLAAVAEIALTFQVQQRLRQLHQQDVFWRELDETILALHQARGVTESARAIAEQVRRLVGADRVSVLIRRGSICRLAAISSAASVDRRSRQVRLLEGLATDALVGGGFEARVGQGSRKRLSENVEAYLDETQLRAVRCELLSVPQAESDSVPPLGALVIDSYSDDTTEAWETRVSVLAPHAAQALQRELQMESRGWRRWLSPARALTSGAGWLCGLAAVAAGITALAILPADFTIEAPGRLMPAERRRVFAPADGIVAEVLVDDGAPVDRDQPLVRLTDPDLELEWSRLQGELQTVTAKLDAVQARRKLKLQDRSMDTSLLSLEEQEHKVTLAGVEQQLDVVRRQRERLTVLSPLAGRVARWDLEQVLQSLPVRHGQELLDVYNPAGPWRLELQVPDDVSGYVRLATVNGPPRVDFVLQTDPATILTARLDSLANTTELSAERELTVLGIVDLPAGLVAAPRRGATVIAKVYCGRRALGFVWFRELIEFLQRRILF